MRTDIKLGPALSRIPGRFSREEKQQIVQEREVLIRDILARCAESTSRYTSVEELAAQKIHRKTPTDKLFMKVLEQHGDCDDHSISGYFYRMTKPCTMTIDIGQGTDPCDILASSNFHYSGLSMWADLRSEDSRFNVRTVYCMNDSATTDFMTAYWDIMSRTPKWRSGKAITAAYDHARKESHQATYQVFRHAFYNAGIGLGNDLATDLFGLLLMSMPDKRNPFPQLTVDSYQKSAPRI